MGYCGCMGYGMHFSANQLGGPKKICVIREYGLSELCVMRESTVYIGREYFFEYLSICEPRFNVNEFVKYTLHSLHSHNLKNLKKPSWQRSQDISLITGEN